MMTAVRIWLSAALSHGGPSAHERQTTCDRPHRIGTQLTLDHVAWSARPFRPTPYYGLRVTRFLADPHWGVALDFTHYKAYAKPSGSVTASVVSSVSTILSTFPVSTPPWLSATVNATT